MEKSLKIVRLKDQDNDFAFWSSKSYIQRLQAVEALRQQFINHRKDVQPRLQESLELLIKNKAEY
jgi:hypothetical protein